VSSSSFAFKGTDTKTEHFCSPLKSYIFNTLYKNICGVFWAKTSHRHSRTSETYFTSCEKGIVPPL